MPSVKLEPTDRLDLARLRARRGMAGDLSGDLAGAR